MRNLRYLNLAFAAAVLAGAMTSSADALIDVVFTPNVTTTKTGFAAIGVATNDFWNACAVTNGNGFGISPNLKFASGIASGVGVALTNVQGSAQNGANDPMYGVYLYNDGNMNVTVTDMAAGTYDFYLYGHGNVIVENSVFHLASGSQAYGAESTTEGSDWQAPAWQEGVQYVEFTNVNVSTGQTVRITATPGRNGYSEISGLQIAGKFDPFIAAEPLDHSVAEGTTVAFSAVGGGSRPFAYQWLFNGTNIPDATNSSCIVTNAQLADAGNYSIIVTDSNGSVASRPGSLSVGEVVAGTINVAFTDNLVTGKTGFAAVGVGTNDFWNTCSVTDSDGSATLADLKFMDGALSGASLTVSNVEGAYLNGDSDPMYGVYLYSTPYNGNITLTVTALQPGVYDFYLYGHGGTPDLNTLFLLKSGLHGYGEGATTTNSNWISPAWQEGVQYVEFPNVTVSPSQAVTITAQSGYTAFSALSGLQIKLPANEPPFTISPTNQVASVDQQLVITNYAFSLNRPISFMLGSNAPAGARLSADGVFAWAPACEQGGATYPITIWATDTSRPPLSNSISFNVSVDDCVQVSVGSSVVQAGQSACVPVSLISSVGLTRLLLTLSYPSGFLTNWSVTSSNPVVGNVWTYTADSSHTEFYFGAQTGHTLQGSTVLGSICLDTLPGASAFVPLTVANLFAATNNSSVMNLFSQAGRVVVIGAQPLLEASLDTNLLRTLTLYGNPGVTYTLLSATNLPNGDAWSRAGAVTLTNLFQEINLGIATNQMQFFRALKL